MNKYVKVKRALAAVLTIVIMMGVCDWSTFTVHAGKFNGSHISAQQVDSTIRNTDFVLNKELSYMADTLKEVASGSEFSKDSLWQSCWDVANINFSNAQLLSDVNKAFFQTGDTTFSRTYDAFSDSATNFDYPKLFGSDTAMRDVYAKTFGTNNEEDPYIPIYITSLNHWNTSGTNWGYRALVSCLYTHDINKPYRYVIEYGYDINFKDDDIGFIVYDSNKLACIGGAQNLEFNDNISEYLLNFINSNEDAILDYYVESITPSDRVQADLNLLNQLIQFIPSGPGEGSFKMSLPNYSLLFENNKVPYINPDGGKGVGLGPGRQIKFNSDFIDWGDSSNLLSFSGDYYEVTGTKHVTIPGSFDDIASRLLFKSGRFSDEYCEQLYVKLTTTVIGAVVLYSANNSADGKTITEADFDDISSKMGKWGFPHVIPQLFQCYNEVFQKVIDSYNLSTYADDIANSFTDEVVDISEFNGRWANVMMSIVFMNVTAMQNGGVADVNGKAFEVTTMRVKNGPDEIWILLNADFSGIAATNSQIERIESEHNCKIKSLKDIWDTELVQWEREYIYSTYSNYLKSYGFSTSSVKDERVLRDVMLTMFADSSNDYSCYGSIDMYDIVSKATEGFVAEPTGSILNNIVYSDRITKYIVGSGLFYTSGEDESILQFFNSYLAELSELNYAYDATKNYFALAMPGSMSLFGDDMEGRRTIISGLGADSIVGGDWARLIHHLYQMTVGFAICNNSEHGVDEGYTAEQLTNLFTKGSDDGISTNWVNDDLSKSSFDNDAISINMLRAIAALEETCTFLGIQRGTWSADIEAYRTLWNDILTEEQRVAILSNPKIKPSITGSIESFAEKEPLAQFFNIEQKKMSDYWNMGFALSATYVPMETNVYDSTTYTFTDNSVWLYDMVYRFGFYRKALYISNDNNAVTNQLMNSSSSSTRVATLSDLINYDRDIILYVDPNFYNANEVNDIISKLDYTAIRNTSESGQTGGDLWSSLKNSMQELFDLDAASVLKTGGNSYYSNSLYSKCSRLGATTETWSERYADLYLLDDEAITNALTVQDEYTVQQSYAVVSAIYRCEQLYNLMLQSLNSDNAVFKSSKSVCANPTATQQDWLSVYNYYMLANLESQMKNDAASSLDLNAPIFIDVFGNILTESGLVIIPAASNPTLVGEHWDPYTVAFPTYYYNGNMLQPGEFTDEFYEWLTGTDYDANTGKFEVVDSEKIRKECGGGYFALDSDGFTIRAGVIESYDISALVNFEQLQKNAKNIKQLFYNIAYYNKTEDIYKKKGRVLTNMIVEVLRGAPIERIDYTYEGLDGNASIGKYGVYAAYKLEELTKSFLGSGGTSGNSMVTMPNLAFMDGIEYIVLYLFKIMFAVFIVGLVVSLYMDAVQNKLGIMSVGRFLFTCIALLVSLTLLPDLISWSYYKANKELLKDEVGYVMMLNYAKDFDGAEIGITSVTTPETSTELYIKLDDVSLDWWSVIYPVLFTNTYKTVNDLYQSQLEDNLMAQQENVILKSDGLYMDVRNIFNSTTLQYQPSTKTFVNYNYNGDSNVTSFVIPYYVILDQLIGDINVYNNAQMIDSYSYSIGSNGHICTYGLIAPYFSSASFLEEGYDILGLHYIHQDMGDISGAVTNSIVFDDDDISRMKLSEWYSHYTGSITNSKIDSLYTYARDWIANNRSMMGKVPDEVFLKVFALEMAIEYNNIFGIPDGKSVEIMNIDTRDIMRFMVGDKANAYKYYSYSFSRYVYEEAGTLGVIVAGIFCAILWITSLVKPLCMIIILGLFVINILGRKLLFRKESKCFEGYLIGCACLCLCNYAYAGMLKVSITVADYGLGAVASLGLGIVVQIVYVFLLVWITSIEMKDWKNNGFYEYANKGSIFVSHMNHTGSLVTNRLIGRGNPAYANRGRHSINRRSLNATGNEMIQQMHERDNVREERALNNSDFDINEEMAGI